MVCEFEPQFSLCADSMEPASDSLSPSSPHPALSLSKRKIETLKKIRALSEWEDRRNVSWWNSCARQTVTRGGWYVNIRGKRDLKREHIAGDKESLLVRNVIEWEMSQVQTERRPVAAQGWGLGRGPDAKGHQETQVRDLSLLPSSY